MRKRLSQAWERTRRFHGPGLLLTGVLWDYATLRLDRVLDHVLLGLYLLVLGTAVVVQLRVHLGTGIPAALEKRLPWVSNVMHFLLGGLLSAYFIYYLNGAPLLRALVWLIVLASAALFIEFVSTWKRLPELWVALYGALVFHYGLAAVPVLWGDFIGPTVPMLGALFASVCLHLLAAIPWKEPDPRVLNRVLFGSSLGVGMVVALELMAWRADLIPPLPLTLMGTEIVSEQHDSYQSGVFLDALGMLGVPPKLKWTPGLQVEARTPVYLPKRMETTVTHVWERWRDDAWVRTDAIDLRIRGGRDEGFRTYSRKRNLGPGPWRVRVLSVDGRSLGTVRFDLERAERGPSTSP